MTGFAFNIALINLINSINEDGEAYYKQNLPNLEYHPVEQDGGRKYIRLVQKNRVYCFVAAVDVPAKGVRKGAILFPASWKAPQLKCASGNPERGNIFEPETYENVNKAYGSWLYAK